MSELTPQDKFVQLPYTEVDGRKWILFKNMDSKVFFRAESIEKPKRISESGSHRVDQTVGEGSPKVAPKRYSIL